MCDGNLDFYGEGFSNLFCVGLMFQHTLSLNIREAKERGDEWNCGQKVRGSFLSSGQKPRSKRLERRQQKPHLCSTKLHSPYAAQWNINITMHLLAPRQWEGQEGTPSTTSATWLKGKHRAKQSLSKDLDGLCLVSGMWNSIPKKSRAQHPAGKTDKFISYLKRKTLFWYIKKSIHFLD